MPNQTPQQASRLHHGETMFATACLTLLLLAQPDPDPPDEPDPDEVSLVGKPAGYLFCGASGRFRLSADVEPKSVRLGETVRLTLTFTAVGPGRLPPQRLKPDELRTVPGLGGRDFDLAPPEPGDYRSTQRWYRKRPSVGDTYQFVYRLRPKRENVAAVPSLPLVYYNPDLRTSDNARRFQVLTTEAVP